MGGAPVHTPQGLTEQDQLTTGTLLSQAFRFDKGHPPFADVLDKFKHTNIIQVKKGGSVHLIAHAASTRY